MRSTGRSSHRQNRCRHFSQTIVLQRSSAQIPCRKTPAGYAPTMLQRKWCPRLRMWNGQLLRCLRLLHQCCSLQCHRLSHTIGCHPMQITNKFIQFTPRLTILLCTLIIFPTNVTRVEGLILAAVADVLSPSAEHVSNNAPHASTCQCKTVTAMRVCI
jgi:hypothetical protein